MVPILGHVRCSVHRLCAGELGWEPDLCEPCLEFRENLMSCDSDEQQSALQLLTSMLTQMNVKLSRETGRWDYHTKRKVFLEGVISDKFLDTAPDDIADQVTVMSKNSENSESLPGRSVGSSCGDSTKASSSASALVNSHQLVDAFKPLFENLFSKLDQSLTQKVESIIDSETGYQYESSQEEEMHSDVQSVSPNSPPSDGFSSHFKLSQNTKDLNSNPFFWDMDYMWFTLTSSHPIEGHKVLFQGEYREFVRHPTYPNAVRPIPDSSQADAPYMSARRAFETMALFLKADRIVGDKLGPKNRCLRLRFEESSGLSSALEILRTCSSTLLHSLFTTPNQVLDKFQGSNAFEDAFVVNFTSGWNFSASADYQKWARDEIICMRETSQILGLSYVIHVPNGTLKAEKNSRTRLVSLLSAFGCLDQLIIQPNSASETTDVLRSVARAFLPCLKEAAFAWIEKKFEIRCAALQFSTAPLASQLYLSDAWDHLLFAPSVVTSLTHKDYLHQGFASMLGLSCSKNESFKTHSNFERAAKIFKDKKLGSRRFFLSKSFTRNHPANKEPRASSSKYHSSPAFQKQDKTGKNSFRFNNKVYKQKHFTKKGSSQTSSSRGASGSKDQQS